MKNLIWMGVIVATVILQSTLLPLIAIKGTCPDMLLIIVVSYALLSGREKGVGMGFFAGLLQDLAFGSIFGTNTISKLATGYIFGLAERKVFKEHVLLPVAATAVATVFNGLVMFMVLFMLGYKADIVSTFMNNVVPLVGYNVIIAIPVHHIVYRLTAFTSE
ncbi:MAG: rod shape-determining protein MreD [Firmicutes bacterium]|nr:rod shape-determining protein MreD [Bacillota bacterium]